MEREGVALIVNDGVPYINVVYERGVMTGNVERMSKNGRIELKSRLINGVEDGYIYIYIYWMDTMTKRIFPQNPSSPPLNMMIPFTTRMVVVLNMRMVH